jgi:hypothetical protein
MDFIVITTSPDNIPHRVALVDGAPDYASYSDYSPTQAALSAAYAAGSYATYTPPPTIETPPTPTPSAFRAALAQTATWITWAETLSPVRYTNLTIAAAQDNWVEAQAIYDAIKATTPPPGASVTAWQALADSNHIPITF